MKNSTRFLIVAGACMLAAGAHAQSLGMGKDGSLKIDAGDGNRLDLGAQGVFEARANDGASLNTKARARTTSRKAAPARGVNIQSDNVQSTTIHGTRINRAVGRGAVSEQTFSGRVDRKTGN